MERFLKDLPKEQTFVHADASLGDFLLNKQVKDAGHETFCFVHENRQKRADSAATVLGVAPYIERNKKLVDAAAQVLVFARDNKAPTAGLAGFVLRYAARPKDNVFADRVRVITAGGEELASTVAAAPERTTATSKFDGYPALPANWKTRTKKNPQGDVLVES